MTAGSPVVMGGRRMGSESACEVTSLATYNYRVLDRKARVIEGTIEAPSDLMARTRLRQEYASILTLEERQTSEDLRNLGNRRVSDEDLAVAIRQIATMLSAGIPLARALRLIAAGASGSFKDLFTSMSLQVESGVSLSHSMRRHPGAFDDVFIRIVESGEVSGRMDSVLNKLADLQEKSVRLRKKVIANFAYPSVLGVTALATLSVFVFYVLPLMQPIFHSLGVELPLLTRIVLVLANSIRNPWIIGPFFLMLLALTAAGIVVWRTLSRSQEFRYRVHYALLAVPLFGPLVEKSTVARVLFTLSTLLESGVSLGPALAVVEKVAGNEVLSWRMGQARKAMVAGGGVYESLQVSGAFPDMVLQMIRAGEESGNLDTMMRRVSAIYEEEVDLVLSSMATTLEPIILMGMGVVIGFITLASFMPMVKLISEI
ncbi:MAG: type II secretion system F family protein [Burkholderiales bacterium]|nr:type II secretion system F family protein [Burkholderiales bacterium]